MRNYAKCGEKENAHGGYKHRCKIKILVRREPNSLFRF